MHKAELKEIVKDNLNSVSQKYSELGSNSLDRQLYKLEQASDNLRNIIDAHNKLCKQTYKEMGC